MDGQTDAPMDGRKKWNLYASPTGA